MNFEKVASAQKPRIEFFDLAKGICISLIMILHMGIDLGLPELEAMRVPLYYVLSGLFFKEYSSFGNFIIRKTNRIVIPLIFFYLLSLGINALYRSLDTTGTVPLMRLFDLFTKNEFYNVAIWFLMSLFWINILFYLIHHYIKKEWIRIIVIILLAGLSRYLYLQSVLLPLFLSPTLTALPFFYFGYLLKKTILPYKNKYDKWNIPIALGLSFIAFLLPNVYVDLRINEVEGSIFVFYFISFIMVIALFLVCKTIGRLPVLSYLGRYSIIVLGTHILIRDPFFFLYGIVLDLKLDSALTAWLSWISIIVVMCLLIIPLCLKVFPYVTAQKDLIPVGDIE